ncbi:DUF3592 domain-containing protein [Arthrobacter bambusae]|uniref:DUF3592 domain-containing protein n=1 Tax=Arthrobacter bambusae TaxID=1338426 RepID=A0AAW8DAZ0_9MICC|nr:DUF3592 domain-containing protein [Arthrobacter bambusae]MDP9903096.1 hypothetical protein [Arthrobacter bambusae]MDQ0128910.1 hypothetical protein [Arthrobacter bambusae]MDQ0180251.1 hypothetical protein [Arthrobacter bambusae]
MKDQPARGAPAEQVSEEAQDAPASLEVSGDAEAWSVALPDGVLLRASPYLGHNPPAWLGSSLRRRMQLGIAFFTLAITVLLIVAGFGVTAALAPFTAGSIRTAGQVTSQQPYQIKRNDHCTLGIVFTLHGQQQEATVDSGRSCTASVQPGTQVELALNPDNPGDIAVLGHGYPREDTWKGIVFAGVAAFVFLGILMVLSVFSYRRTRRLFSQGTRWHEVSAIVRIRTRDWKGTTLLLDAQDTEGNTRAFTMDIRGSGPWWPKPRQDDTLNLTLLANGTEHAAISIEGDHRLYPVRLAIRYKFQFRSRWV